MFLQLDININGIQNTLGPIGSRTSVYMGKLLFLLFFSAINMLLYEVCFYVGVKWSVDMETMGFVVSVDAMVWQVGRSYCRAA